MQLPIELEQFPHNWDGARLAGGGEIQRHGTEKVSFVNVASLENLLTAWYEFRKGKCNRQDIRLYEYNLEDNIFALHKELTGGHYVPDKYQQFRINDPKPRLISKASVRDRLVHHAIYRLLYPLFDQSFIHDSYSCRNSKGTHKAFNRIRRQILSCGRNYTRPVFALKCDIRRFFDTVDHKILLGLIRRKIDDARLVDLLQKVISSFEVSSGKGMPIGNLTSQLFANIYLDPRLVKRIWTNWTGVLLKSVKVILLNRTKKMIFYLKMEKRILML